MRKTIILLIFLLILTSCATDYPGNNTLVCETYYTYLPEKAAPEEFEMEWLETTTIKSIDNYIVGLNQKFEFMLKKPALEYLNNNLEKDKEALAKKYIELAIGNYREFYDNLEKQEINYFEDKIIVITKNTFSNPKQSWKTIIIPEESNFKDTYKTFSKLAGTCTLNNK